MRLIFKYYENHKMLFVVEKTGKAAENHIQKEQINERKEWQNESENIFFPSFCLTKESKRRSLRSGKTAKSKFVPFLR